MFVFGDFGCSINIIIYQKTKIGRYFTYSLCETKRLDAKFYSHIVIKFIYRVIEFYFCLTSTYHKCCIETHFQINSLLALNVDKLHLCK